MKKITLLGLLSVLCSFTTPGFTQALVSVDALVLLHELPQPCSTLTDAFQRVYPLEAKTPNTAAFYHAWSSKLEAYAQQAQTLSANFYRQNPLGFTPASVPVTSNNVSPAQQVSMEAATRDLAQKMLSDPAFAQKFAQMSEAEQHAYLAEQLSKHGIKPVAGTPNRNVAAPAGLDKNWMEMCSELMQSTLDMSWMNLQSEVQVRYTEKHAEVNKWAETEIKKLPMISFGEYGHDHDPEKVKAIQQQARVKHADVANTMLKEMRPLFLQFRKQFSERISQLNAAFKEVNYGKAYNFGMFYNQVLQAQTLMLTGQHTLLSNEINVLEECARWEFERRNL
ncbi:hypothetical protein [Haliscomenobacter hydrossis]|uniref:Outer membrane efflux protein n=1 Tax=Haliscomenobacter hydrossis (strain ATCC 27775 / DSM 1100 / LMG 10767 / O) TaxID=760192 RepID=F4KUN5_HALH1|nr:hypothetical protein [Haliscomenobacter hydrossis]AEE53438.1 hypothetical protein Halhy_5614 [Haliscomenobacter hydrossis DSM 1100]